MDRMLLTVCLFSPAQTQDITLIVPDQPIRAAVGENAVLLCHLEPPTDLEQDMVEWSFNDQTVWVYRNKKENTMDQAKQFSKRVTFSGNKKSGNISVTLQSVNKTDEGNYTCHVERGGKSFRANITLLVEEKCEADWTIGVQQNPNITLIVPDQPIRAAVGENAVLLCHLEPPTDLEQDMVEWSFNDQTVWLYRNQKENPTDQAKEFSKRVTFSGNKNSGNISVTLQSVTKTDEGDYTCHVERNREPFRAIITLLVEEKREKKEQNNKNITPLGNPTDNVEPTKSAGAVVGAGVGFGVVIAVAVVVAVAVVGAVAIYRKWKKPKCRGSETGTQTEAETVSLPPQPEAVAMGGPASQSLKNRKSSPLKPQLKTRAR
ncbi:junctional adhesion molecule-like isoform X7 [Genypterus blacodes]|uniref:junctional adhesion molecule-like isoform X7 n=1 Tax=Genypterus blacodes TaxID=154954 RepID=UPI003F75B3A3